MKLKIKLPTLAEVERDRVGKSFWKKPIAQPVVRQLKARKAKSAEDDQKAKVRRRDKYCRFPLCGCRTFKLRLEVSHQQHKGAGGNPKGDRSKPEKMIYLCAARHKENSIAVDRGTARWRPLTKRGAAGPVAWDVDTNRMRDDFAAHAQKWVEVARETRLHVYEPLTPKQQQILEALAAMTS